MYARHFGFREDPFGAAADPRFLYFSRHHAEALAALHYGLVQRRGLLVLTARPGMGKTTLLHHLVQKWKDKADVAFLYRPPESREEMLAEVLADLGVPAGAEYAENCRRLRDLAAEARRKNRRLLLVFDEAQGIPGPVLEEIRRLSNLEAPGEKLLDVILAGQPGLEANWTGEQGEALRQRVGVWAAIPELDAAEVRRYIEHRVRAAGRRRGSPFRRRAVELVAERSGGVPRNINAICFQALSAAFAKGKKRVGAEECGGLPAPRLVRWAAALAGAAVLALGGTGYWQRKAELPRVTTASAAAPPPALTDRSPAEPPPAPIPGRRAGPAAPPRPAGKRVRVQRSETMRRIALRTYGRWDPEIWKHVRNANPGLTDPGRLLAGQVLVLPALTDGGSP